MRFSPEFLRRLEMIPSLFRIRDLQTVCDDAGRHDSHRLGSGTEFAQHRKYGPGDDIRYLDWKLYARLGTLYTKEYSAEGCRAVRILIDSSGSMAFGSPTKFDHALNLAAGIMFFSLRALDRVSLLAWNTRIRETLLNLRGIPSFARGIRFLESLRPDNEQTDLAACGHELVSRRISPGPVWILGDFYDPEGLQYTLTFLRHYRYTPVLIRITDPSETNCPPPGFYTLIDSETGARKEVEVTGPSRKEYVRRFEEYSSTLRSTAKRFGVRMREASTAVPAETFLLRLVEEFR